MSASSENSKRLAKNTLILYVRMLLVLVVSLYTSRVILDSLGEVDYGVYNVVGGVVAMVAIITTPMVSVIQRFLSFELGGGDLEKLSKVFSTSVNIQLLLSGVIFILFEIIGVWFLNNKMNIPYERMVAANWALQCSLLVFLLNVNRITYSACIMAHEKMDMYAYLSIFEVLFKLLIAYLIYVSSIDKLIVYSVLLLLVNIILFAIHAIYCKKHFEEVTYSRYIDKPLFKEMASFAGWSFLGDTTAILNTQGVNVLINLFFDVKLNAARGIAVQVDAAAKQFVTNFTVAMYPQITKSYAANDRPFMFKLMSQGSKYSFYIMLLLALPIFLEADTLLGIWLVEVPEQTSIFLRLIILTSLCDSIQNTFSVGIDATGKIKRYQLRMNSLNIMVFLLSWLFFSLGMPAYITYVVSSVVSFLIIGVKLSELKRLMDFPVKHYLKDYFAKILLTGVLASILPFILQHFMEQSITRFFVIIGASVIWSVVSIWLVGLNKYERIFFRTKVSDSLKKILRKQN